jgi:hypothetical protein
MASGTQWALVAVHEAGHAVVAILEGGRLIKVVLEDCAETEGRTFCEAFPFGVYQSMEKALKRSLAGETAEDSVSANRPP